MYLLSGRVEPFNFERTVKNSEMTYEARDNTKHREKVGPLR